MSLLPEYMKASAIASAKIYADIDVNIVVAKLLLSNVGLVVRYSDDIFGDNAAAVGSYISTSMNDAAMLIKNVDELLVFGGYFDHSSEKAERAVSYELKAQGCFSDADATNRHLMQIAETNKIPDFFTKMKDVPQPKELLCTRVIGLAPVALDILLRHDMAMQMAKNMVAGAEGLMKISIAYEEAFLAEATNVWRLYRQCERQRPEIENFAQRMQINPFA